MSRKVKRDDDEGYSKIPPIFKLFLVLMVAESKFGEKQDCQAQGLETGQSAFSWNPLDFEIIGTHYGLF